MHLRNNNRKTAAARLALQPLGTKTAAKCFFQRHDLFCKCISVFSPSTLTVRWKKIQNQLQTFTKVYHFHEPLIILMPDGNASITLNQWMIKYCLASTSSTAATESTEEGHGGIAAAYQQMRGRASSQQAAVWEPAGSKATHTKDSGTRCNSRTSQRILF